jgi:hypothetical protein
MKVVFKDMREGNTVYRASPFGILIIKIKEFDYSQSLYKTKYAHRKKIDDTGECLADGTIEEADFHYDDRDYYTTAREAARDYTEIAKTLLCDAIDLERSSW